MASPAPRAARVLYALIAAAALASGSSARAQDDPFALPENLTAQAAERSSGPVLTEIAVDGRVLPRLINVDGKGDAITMDAGDARAAGLPVPDAASGPVLIRSLPLYKWSFDKLAQRLSIQLLRNSDGANFRDLAKTRRMETHTRSMLALRIDYDLTTTLSSREQSAAGQFDAALVRGNVSLASGARLSVGNRGVQTVTRLDSALAINIPRANTVVTVGDYISAGTLTQRPIRLGGVQVASNFDLRPDLVTMPLPSFTGQVAVPTSVDIVTADQRYNVGSLEPGKFTLQNVPIPAGRGQFAVVTTDALGREIVQNTRFYASRDLLAPGLTGYAVNAGFVRRRFGERSSEYGSLVASAFLRRGLSPFMTVEGSAEGTGGVFNLGARTDFTLGNVALLSVEGRISHDAFAGTGTLVRLAAESVSSRFGMRGGIVLPGSSYRDVASRLGDPTPPRQLFGEVSYLANARSQFQLSYVRQSEAPSARLQTPARSSQTLSGTMRTVFGKSVDFFAAGGMRRLEGRSSIFASVGISVQFGGGRQFGSYASLDDRRPTLGGSFKQDDTKPGELGYAVSASLAPGFQRIGASAQIRTRPVQVEGLAEEVNGRFATRLNAHGSLLVAGKTVYARGTRGGSYALVRTGKVANVAIKLENHVVGKTDQSGRLLVENVAPLVPMQVDVDSERLPSDAMVRKARHVIAVPRRAVALVDMDVVAFRPVLRQIVTGQGTPIEAGASIVALPSGTRSMVGFDGMAEINALGGDSRLAIQGEAITCEVSLPDAESLENGTAPLTCLDRSMPDGPAAPAADYPLAATKVARRD